MVDRLEAVPRVCGGRVARQDDARCPVLIIKGEDDFWVPLNLIEYSAALIGDKAEIRVLPDIGHYPMFEDPEGLAALVDEFVSARAAVARG
jgi:pimeloyl-ACP methyl ester carboxylesterase